MSDVENDSPRRYMVDGCGQRVLVGLTIEETIEFETLEGSTARSLYHVQDPWNERHVSGRSHREVRWRELYAKHEHAWSEWIAQSRARSTDDSRLLN
ncbi:hypothetical protein ACVWXO_011071 [Bradyrhizobium sp. LM2.7]